MLPRTTGSWLSAGLIWPRSSLEGDVRVRGVRRVHERHEPGQLLRVLEGGLPLVDVRPDVPRHRRLELGTEAERVVHDDLAHPVQPAVEGVDPGGGALEPVGGADVVHEVAVEVADQGLGVEVAGQQPRVRGVGAAVAADVQVPALLGGDDPEVLGPRLGALAGTAADAALELVRRAEPAVAQLQRDREAHGVLHAVPAPGGADARLHRAQRLAVGVAGLEAGVDQPPPDRGQLLHPRAEQVDPLAAGDLGVEVEVPGHLADHDQLVRA